MRFLSILLFVLSLPVNAEFVSAIDLAFMKKYLPEICFDEQGNKRKFEYKKAWGRVDPKTGIWVDHWDTENPKYKAWLECEYLSDAKKQAYHKCSACKSIQGFIIDGGYYSRSGIFIEKLY